jgi:uncharacterized repeat protein (TIGR01451 family)
VRPRAAFTAPAAWALAGALAAFPLPREAGAQVVRAFTPRFSQNASGDVTLVGNTLMTCPASGACTSGRNGTGGSVDNGDFNMTYVDVDADATTFCSSSATLALPAGATVLWAGLYWGGDSNDAARNTVRLATPAAAYATLTATRLDAGGTAYQGFADVTARVQAAGNGTYTVANVRSTTGPNRFAGWSLVVVYRDLTLPPRNLVVFDGYAQVTTGAPVSFTVSGFLTPPLGAVTTRLGVVAYEGDLGSQGDRFRLNGTPLGDAVNPANNFFNSSIGALGATVTTRNPNYANQLGLDIDLVNASGILPNNATSATVGLTSANDQYYPGVVSFATDLYAPVIQGNSFTKAVVDLDGAPARPGDLLEYTLVMTNTGQDAALQTVLCDTLPPNAGYVAGSMVVVTGANAGAKSDAAGDDQMDYDAGARRVVARLGTGADATQGGRLDPGAGASVRFQVRIGSPAPNGSTVSNQGGLSFVAEQIGSTITARSDGDAATPGFQPTSLTVTAPVMSGVVFEDANYGGGAGRGLAASGGTPRPGARVELYDALGAFLASATTDAAGRYAFDGYAPGAYTIRVVNASVASSRPGAVAGLLPVQTWRADASSGVAVADPDRVGGEIPARADAAANTTNASLASLTTGATTAQSVAPVTLGIADIGSLDFGFCFDAIVNVNDAGQGSFRQFLLNANALGNAGLAQAGQSAGTEGSIFMVSDGAAHPGLRAGLANLLAGGVASIAVASALPAITDAATRVDGTTQTANVGDTNPGTLGAGGVTGVDALALATVARPEVEILDGAAVAVGLDLEAANATVRGLAVSGFGNAPGSDANADLKLGAAAGGAVIQDNVVGTRAGAFADPGAAARSGGDHVRVAGADDGTLSGNLIGFGTGSGVALTGAADLWLLTGNEIRGNAIGAPGRDGVSLESSGSETLRGNLVIANEGAGVDAGTSTGSNTIENNTLTGNGISASAAETPGVRLGGAGSRVDRDVIASNFGAGVLVLRTAAGNVITRNSIEANGTVASLAGGVPTGEIGIDLLAAGDDGASGTSPYVTLNDPGDADAGGNGLINAPVLESALVANGSFTLTGWARPGSVIELFAANPDPSGFGEGRLYLATLVEGSGSDLDASAGAYSGTINGVAQGSDNTNRFRFTLPVPGAIGPGARLTATATTADGTSEFSGLVTVTTGVSVAGTAYADLDHDALRDPPEAGTGAALWAKLVPAASPTSATQVVAVDAASGAYAFGFVAAGDYAIVLDDNASAADVTPTCPAGWIGTEMPAGTRAVSVAGTDVAGQDFGLWRGGRASGTVFRDDGAGGGIANDGARQPGESGIAGTRVRLGAAACAGGVCDSALTDGAGAFTLWIPVAAAGSVVEIRETDPSGFLSTGGGAGTTGGAYARAADAVSFVAVAGRADSGLAFGDVPANAFAPDGTQSIVPGGVAFYAHTFVAGSAGVASFTVTQTPSPAIPGWGVALYRDLNCDGVIDPGEPPLATPIALAAGQSLCVIARHTAPAGTPAGATEQLALGASLAYTNASPALVGVAGITDLTQVTGGAGGLLLLKSADRAVARPGDLITYTLTYSNPGPEALSAIVIHDATPAYTTFESAGCLTLAPGLTACAVTTQPAVGAGGPVQWTLAGALAPGGSGSVVYSVRIQ